MNTMLGEKCMLKILFMRSQKEMRPMLLDTREETIFLSGRNTAQLCSHTGFKIELDYLAEEISQKYASFLLALIVKYKRKEKLWYELLSKKEPDTQGRRPCDEGPKLE